MIKLNKSISMKKVYVLIAGLLFFSMTILAQKAAKSVFAEIGGPGITSLNFDTRFAKKENGLGMRVGVGGFSIGGASIVFLPVGLNYLIGKDGKNYFELGAGLTPIVAIGTDSTGKRNSRNGPFDASFGHLNLGYRLQPSKSGFTFRASINPIFGKGFFWPFYGGVSFGYKF
jgi:hypothetical protein